MILTLKLIRLHNARFYSGIKSQIQFLLTSLSVYLVSTPAYSYEYTRALYMPRDKLYMYTNDKDHVNSTTLNHKYKLIQI